MAAVATFWKKNPIRASSTTGSESQCADRQPDGVHAEVVAELVGEHAGELAPGQLGDGERRDDDEMPTAGERVELVGGSTRRM